MTRRPVAFALFVAGRLVEKLGRTGFASRLYRTSLDVHPGSARRRFALGRTHEKSGRWRPAAEAYAAAVDLDPLRAAWQGRLGNARRRARQWEGAADAYRRAAELEPDRASWHFGLGRSRERLRVGSRRAWDRHLGLVTRPRGDWEGAIAAYERAVLLEPSRARYHHHLGRARARLSDHEGAAVAYRRALALDDGDPRWHHALATALRRIDDHDGAVAALEATLALDPTHETARLHLTRLHLDRCDWPSVSRTVFPESGGASAEQRGLVALLEAPDEPSRSNEKERVAETVRSHRDRADRLPVEWWLGLHFRLLRRGWVRLAYEVKDVAATVAVARHEAGDRPGLDGVVDAATALLCLSRDDEALVLLDDVRARSSDRYVAAAADRLAADVRLATGALREPDELVALRAPMPVEPPEAAFGELVEGKRVAIVGPAPSTDALGGEIDGFDVVVRPNVVPGARPPGDPSFAGSRTDVGYYVTPFTRAVGLPTVVEAIERGELQFAVFRRPAIGGDWDRLDGTGRCRSTVAEFAGMFRAIPFSVSRIAYDLVHFRPETIKVFNVDFFLSEQTYVEGYRPETIGRWAMHRHDLRAEFGLVSRLARNGWVDVPPPIRAILDMDTTAYLAALEAATETPAAGGEERDAVR